MPPRPSSLLVTGVKMEGDTLGTAVGFDIFVGEGEDEGDGVNNGGVSAGAQVMWMSPSYGFSIVSDLAERGNNGS